MSDEPNPRVVGLVRASANRIRAANPDATSREFALAAHKAAMELCSQALKPSGAMTFDVAITMAALLECWIAASKGEAD